MAIQYSVIIPVYNRPEEIVELLDSLSIQKEKVNFEVIVVEDGSVVTAEKEINQFSDKLNIRYIYQKNQGPAGARNKGAEYACGDYFLFFDSDCVLPEDYFTGLTSYLEKHDLDLFGGPDKADRSFTPVQKAISYSMTSILTTGGIRGGKKKMDKFYPRSFNLGVKKEFFRKLNGFSDMRFGEDMDFSMRAFESKYKVGLVSDAFVFHKRRTTFKSFYKQVFGSGTARVDLSYRHKGTLKLVHLFPVIFVIGIPVCLLFAFFFHWIFILPFFFVFSIIFIHALFLLHSFRIAALSVYASIVQIIGYGIGFIYAMWIKLICPKKKLSVFEESFYQ